MSTKRAHRLQISPDPQNLSWTSDKSSFGFRMLQKMGWTEGKGLGSNEDGNVDHVKITKKIDNRGVGASYQTINAWKETNNHFDSLLKTLNDAYGANTSSSENGESKKRKSSEEEEDSSSSSESEEEEKKEPAPQVKRIPRHLIYQKRHNAKNVMNYSKTDLSAILARPTDQPKKDHFKKEEDAEVEETNGATYIHKKESMYDYFNKKTKVITSTEEEEERPSFGLGFSNNGSTNGTAIGFQYNDTNNEENNNTEETQPVKEKKKKKKQEEQIEEPVQEEPSKKKKKKSKELVVEEIEMTYAEEQTTEVKKKKKKKQVEEPQPVEETKKSKKKKNKNEEVVEEQPAEEEAIQEPPRKKKKKSKDVVEEEQPVDEGSKKKKKKQVVEEVQPEDNTEKKKKKKKKKTEE